MKLEMICTGEEVLAGQIVDTNAAWCGSLLMEHGIEMSRRVTVGDRLDDLVSVFQERSLHADVILVNGGLGPTEDDMSALAMAQAKGEPLIASEMWRERLEQFYSSFGREMPESNLKQIMLPESAVMIDNPVGTACGFRVKLNRAWLYFTPGVPHEFKKMVADEFIPFIKNQFDLTETTRLHKLLTFGVGESSLADNLNTLPLPEGITLGYRSSMPHIEIKLFARGEVASMALPDTVSQVKQRLGDYLVSDGKPTLAEEVHELLLEKEKTLSIAESCTGGMITNQLIDLAGSSSYLHQGLVTYCNESKQKVLGVPSEVLEKYGAVSTQTAIKMAEGARNILGSDFALSTTGVAGPDGGTKEKPVGTVAIALVSENDVWVQVVDIPLRTRSTIRAVSAAIAFDMLRRALNGTAPIIDYAYIKRNKN